MTNQPKNIHSLLSSWGNAQHRLPDDHDMLKTKLLEGFDRRFELSGPTAKRRLPWLSMAFAGIAVIVLVSQQVASLQRYTLTSSEPMLSAGNAPGGETVSLSATKQLNFPFLGDTSSVKDTREFLKTGYHAALQTGNVNDTALRAQGIIHGLGGRIDNLNISKQRGSMNFVVPASQFFAFQTQINGLVRARFITETINTQNLLPQKQGIEQRQDTIADQLAQLRTSRSQLITSHNRTIADLQSRINASTDPYEQELLRNQLINENGQYARKLSSIDSQIATVQKSLTSTNTDNQDLLENVATVDGTLSFEYISTWGVINSYLGPYWLPLLLLAAAIIAYLNYRRKRFIVDMSN